MNSIFGIGVLEFIFILIFALIFLGPDRLPKVTRDVLQFIRRLQKLSGDLTRQVNEEIGDLRDLDPSYHMRQLMDDEEEEEEKPTARARQKKGTASSRQTSAPSQPSVGETIGDGSAEEEEKTIAPETAASTAAPALSDLNTSTSSNGRQQNEDSTETKSTATTIPTAPRADNFQGTDPQSGDRFNAPADEQHTEARRQDAGGVAQAAAGEADRPVRAGRPPPIWRSATNAPSDGRMTGVRQWPRRNRDRERNPTPRAVCLRKLTRLWKRALPRWPLREPTAMRRRMKLAQMTTKHRLWR